MRAPKPSTLKSESLICKHFQVAARARGADPGPAAPRPRLSGKWPGLDTARGHAPGEEAAPRPSRPLAGLRAHLRDGGGHGNAADVGITGRPRPGTSPGAGRGPARHVTRGGACVRPAGARRERAQRPEPREPSAGPARPSRPPPWAVSSGGAAVPAGGGVGGGALAGDTGVAQPGRRGPLRRARPGGLRGDPRGCAMPCPGRLRGPRAGGPERAPPRWPGAGRRWVRRGGESGNPEVAGPLLSTPRSPVLGSFVVMSKAPRWFPFWKSDAGAEGSGMGGIAASLKISFQPFCSGYRKGPARRALCVRACPKDKVLCQWGPFEGRVLNTQQHVSARPH